MQVHLQTEKPPTCVAVLCEKIWLHLSTNVLYAAELLHIMSDNREGNLLRIL